MTILLTGTNWWQSPARLSLALARTGSRIAVMFPVGSPVHSIRAVSMAFPYSAMNPVASLGHAIRDARPDLIIPTDDRTVSHLHQLHALSDDPQVRALVEHSIGSPGGYSSLRVRAEIMNLAKEEGILVPESMALSDTKEMEKVAG